MFLKYLEKSLGWQCIPSPTTLSNRPNSSFLLLILILFEVISSNAQKGSDASQFDQAFAQYKAHSFPEALKICALSTHKKQGEEAACLAIKGLVFMDSISFQEGIKYFEEAKKILTNSSDIKLVSKVYFGLGKCYYNTARYQESIREFLLLEKLAIQNKMKAEEKSANYYMAQDYQALGKISISNYYAKRGLQLSRELKDTASIFRNYSVCISNYTFTARNYINTKDSVSKENIRLGNLFADSAILLLKELEKYSKVSNYAQQASIADLYSSAWGCKGDMKKAIAFAHMAFQNFEKSGDRNNTIILCNILADAYTDAGKYDSALIYLKTSEKLKKELGSGLALGDERGFKYSLYRAYKGLSREKEALLALEAYLLEDMKLNESRNVDLQKLREEFEAEKTNLRIKSETEKARELYERKRNLYLISSAGILILLSLIAYFLYYRFKTQKERDERTLQILLQNAELTALKAQMNPHFIFNALNSIQHSIVTNNTDEAFRFLSKFSRLIRNVLDSSSEQLIPLKTEIETLSLYLEIESKRFDNSFSFELIVEENSYSEDEIQIPPMILQPFIENAIWHGLMPKEGEKKLTITFSIPDGNSILCEISDNGIGREKAKEISAAKGKKHQSRGIDNIMDRVKLLRMTLQMNVLIELIDKKDADGVPTGTQVKVTFQREEKRV